MKCKGWEGGIGITSYLSASTLPTLALSSSLSDFSSRDLNDEI